MACAHRVIREKLQVGGFQISADRLGAEWHGAIDPGADSVGQVLYVAAEVGGISTPALMSPDCRRFSRSA